MEKFEKIITLKNELEAKRIEPVLKEQNIPYGIITYRDSAYDDLWQPQRGWGHIEAPGAFKEAIKAIYKDLFSLPA